MIHSQDPGPGEELRVCPPDHLAPSIFNVVSSFEYLSHSLCNHPCIPCHSFPQISAVFPQFLSIFSGAHRGVLGIRTSFLGLHTPSEK